MSILRTLAVLLLLATPSFAQHSPEDLPAQQVAHGAEKEAHKIAHPDEDHGSGHAAPKTYFGIPGWILKTLNMIVFVSVLVYLLKGSVGSFFRGRRDGIRQQLEEAKVRRAKAENLAADIQARLAQMEAEVSAIMQRSADEGERQKQELLAAAEAEAAKILTTANAEIDARLKQARAELAAFAGQLATERAHTLLQTRLTEEDRRRLFDQSLQNISEARS